MQIEVLVAAFLTAHQHTFQPNTRLAYGYDLRLLSRAFPDLDAADLTTQHLRAFLHDTADRRNRLLFTLLYETGLRVGEALDLHIPDVLLNTVDGGALRVLGKGNKERLVPLIDAPRTVRLLRTTLKQLGSIGPLFRGDQKKGGHSADAVHRTTVFYHFERYVAAAQTKHPDVFAGEVAPITIHRLRHTYATLKLRAVVSLPALRKLMGHKNLQTTLRYTVTDLRELHERRRALILLAFVIRSLQIGRDTMIEQCDKLLC